MEGCKWYKDEFCVNADSPCVADYCPCTEYFNLCKYYSDGLSPTYDELYEHWLKTKDKKKRKRKNVNIEPLPGQVSLFDTTE